MARARRGRRRFTPRRWLPFVALSVLIAGAAVLDTDRPQVAPERLDASLDVTALPSVSRADAISTAFYCAGGTAQGEGGMAELSLVLANDAPAGATAEVTLFTAEGDPEVTSVDVPANGRARLRASEVVEGDWVGALVEVRGGRVAVDREVSGPLGYDAAPCAVEAADRWFVPSGSTLRGTELYLSFFNPFPDTASVDVSFATDTGARAPRSLRRLSVPGRSIRVVPIADLVTDRAEIATSVRVRAGRVVVDRIQTYDGTGDPVTTSGDRDVTTPAPEGLVSTPASPVRAPRWIIPSSRLTAGVRTQIGVFNTSGTAARVDVVLRYQDAQLEAELAPVELTLRAHEQTVVDLATVPGLVADRDLWVDVVSLDGVPIVAERTSAFGAPSSRTGVATALGSPIGATRWLVTQAGPSRTRTGLVQVANPGTADALLRIFTLEAGDRRELMEPIELAGGERRTIQLDEAAPAASIIVESDQQVVVASSLSSTEGQGVALVPASPFPETVVSLPALG